MMIGISTFAVASTLGWINQDGLLRGTGLHGILGAGGFGFVQTLRGHIAANNEPSEASLGNFVNVPDYKDKLGYIHHALDEAASDVLGILNIGPAAGLGHALVFISFTEAGSGRRILRNNNPVSAVHPISALRILLAADVIRNLPQFDNVQSKKWADTLEDLVDKYTVQKDNFELYIRTGTDPATQVVANIPYKQMRETVKIVAKTVALRPLKQLDGHSFNEINTWSTSDEILVQRIATDFLEKREPSIESQPHEVEAYAAHILAGSVIALAGSADIYETTEHAVSALNQLYKKNSMFRGLPFTFRSDIYMHRLVTVMIFFLCSHMNLKKVQKKE
jgi:hypothetical protein